MIFAIFLIAYSISKKNYYNLTLAFSFLITGYRPLTEILLCIGLQLFGAFAATLFLIALGHPLPKYTNYYSFTGLTAIEFLASFIITLSYYCLFIDMRNNKEKSKIFAVAAIYGGVSLAFPNLSNGNVLKVFAGLNDDLELVFGTLLGNLFGSLFAGVLYKFFICENQSLKMKEIDITDNNDVNINF